MSMEIVGRRIRMVFYTNAEDVIAQKDQHSRDIEFCNGRLVVDAFAWITSSIIDRRTIGKWVEMHHSFGGY